MKHSFLISALLLVLTNAFSQAKRVMVMDIKNEIDPRMTRQVELALDHARETNADIVIVEMNTFGGAVPSAMDIADKIMTYEKPIWVYVNSNAFSAGALISLACDSIYMSPRGRIGAATVIYETGEKAIEKMQSAMSTVMRTAAEQNKRDPRIAEGMVNENIEIPGIKKLGQIITFSTSEAIQNNYCEGKVESIEEILAKNQIDQYTVDHFQLSSADAIINFFMNPFISGILIMIIIGGIYFELQSPGIGLPLFAALGALAMYLTPYYLNGLAENWEILCLLVGIILVGLEIFVIPGFGIAGVIGIALTLGSLVLIMINNRAFDFEFVHMHDLLWAIAATSTGFLGVISLLFFGGASLTNSRAFQRMALTDTQQRGEGYTANFNRVSMKGKQGITHTVLRPSGRVVIEGQLFDAFTKGGYIEQGVDIEVIEEEGSTLKVKIVGHP